MTWDEQLPDEPSSPAYWTGVHCTDCGVALTTVNGARRPMGSGFFALVCVDCLLDQPVAPTGAGT